MDERYWIIKECVHLLRDCAFLHMRPPALEVKLLRLKVELLKCEGELRDVDEAIAFRDLNVLVRELVSDGNTAETCGQILQSVDTLLAKMREQNSGKLLNH